MTTLPPTFRTDADLMRTAAVLLARYGTCLLTLADVKGALYDRESPGLDAQKRMHEFVAYANAVAEKLTERATSASEVGPPNGKLPPALVNWDRGMAEAMKDYHPPKRMEAPEKN